MAPPLSPTLITPIYSQKPPPLSTKRSTPSTKRDAPRGRPLSTRHNIQPTKQRESPHPCYIYVEKRILGAFWVWGYYLSRVFIAPHEFFHEFFISFYVPKWRDLCSILCSMMFHNMFHSIYFLVPFVPFVWYNRFMEQYVKINVKESVRIKLKQLAAENGQTLADYIESLVRIAPVENDLLDELDRKSSDPYEFLRQNLDEDELPECCQGVFTGLAKDRCEHWEWVNGGWKNKVTGKYANDPAYYHYL